MISIAKIEPEGTDYLFQHSTHEYMEEQTDEKGVFKGRLAKFQGLENKEVTKELFDKQMSHGKDFKGVEIDPSPSKDWSTFYNRASPTEREQLKNIWNSAMNDVCKAIEQNTYYRETKNGKTEYKLAKGVCMAQFNHHTSRPVNGQTDYQDHSHIVVFPKVLGQDNKFHSHTLMDLKYEKNNHETLRYIDAVMNHGLCKGLQGMGVSVSPDGDSFKIDCIQEDVSKNFSKRTNQINEIAGENASYAEKKKVSLQIRERKSKNDLTALREGWQEKMDSMGFTEDKLFKSKQKDYDKSLSEISKEKDKYVFSNKELKTLAYQQACFSTKTFEQKLGEFKSDNKLVKVSKNHSIFQSNYSMSRLAKELKTRTMTKSLAKKNTLQVAKPSKPTRAMKSAKGSSVKGNGSLFEKSSRSGESIHECLSEIKNLETELSSLKLDDPQRAKLEAKIGDLKEKIKQIEKEGEKSQTVKASVSNKQHHFELDQDRPDEEKEKEKEQDEPKGDKKEELKAKVDKGETKSITDQIEEKLESELPHKAHADINDLAKTLVKQDVQANLQKIQEAQKEQAIQMAPVQ